MVIIGSMLLYKLKSVIRHTATLFLTFGPQTSQYVYFFFF